MNKTSRDRYAPGYAETQLSLSRMSIHRYEDEIDDGGYPPIKYGGTNLKVIKHPRNPSDDESDSGGDVEEGEEEESSDDPETAIQRDPETAIQRDPETAIQRDPEDIDEVMRLEKKKEKKDALIGKVGQLQDNMAYLDDMEIEHGVPFDPDALWDRKGLRGAIPKIKKHLARTERMLDEAERAEELEDEDKRVKREKEGDEHMSADSDYEGSEDEYGSDGEGAQLDEVGKKEKEALNEIRREQRRVDDIIRCDRFQLLVKEIAQDYSADIHFDKEAIEALQAAAEHFLIDSFEAANLIAATHAERDILEAKDMLCARRVSNYRIDPYK